MGASSQDKLVLWHSPLKTLYHFPCEIVILMTESFEWIKQSFLRRIAAFFILYMIIVVFLLWNIGLLDEINNENVPMEAPIKKIVWGLYWFGLGVLSSVAFGGGVHTFILYLGPHIAMVSLAAYKCSSLNFPEPPYPDYIKCPDESANRSMKINPLAIMDKVQLEFIMWAIGTTLVERVVTLMEIYSPVEELDSFNRNENRITANYVNSSQIRRSRSNANSMATRLLNYLKSSFYRAGLCVHHSLQKVGFIEILACAAIPNSFYKLAGLSRGHCLIPFSTFFGVFMIGKAVIKVHIQALLVMMAFSEKLTKVCLEFIGDIPFLGQYLTKAYYPFNSSSGL